MVSAAARCGPATAAAVGCALTVLNLPWEAQARGSDKAVPCPPSPYQFHQYNHGCESMCSRHLSSITAPFFACCSSQFVSRFQLHTHFFFEWGVLKGFPSCIGLAPQQKLGTVMLGGACVMLGAVGACHVLSAPVLQHMAVSGPCLYGLAFVLAIFVW